MANILNEQTLLCNSHYSKSAEFLDAYMLLILALNSSDRTPQWQGWGNHLRWSLIYYIIQSRLHSLPSSQPLSSKAALWHVLHWWWPYLMATIFHPLFLTLWSHSYTILTFQAPCNLVDFYLWSFLMSCTPASSIYGLGKLSDGKFVQLERSVDFLLTCMKYYQSKTPSEWQTIILQPFVKLLEYSVACLESVNINFHQMEFSIQDMQHIWLEITILLDYMEIYKPQMDGHAPSTSEVANTIDVLIHDLWVAQDCFTAGLPCWLICPASYFTNQVIHKVVVLEHAECTLSFSAHTFPYSILFTGLASLLQKYHLIHQYAKIFLHAPD